MNQGPYRKRARKEWKRLGLPQACREHFQDRYWTMAEAQHVFGASERSIQTMWAGLPSDLNIVEEGTTMMFNILCFDKLR